MRRYPMVVLFVLVLLASAGVVYGIKRPPVYTASTELNVGVPNSDSQGTPGYVLAAEQLASAYSREATSQVVIGPAGKALSISAAETASRLSSSAVPDSPTFSINATGPTAAAAISLANRATAVLRTKVNTGVQSQSAGALLMRYNRLQAQANQLTTASGKLQGRYEAQSSGSGSTVTGGTNTAAAGTTTPHTVTAAQVNAAKLQAQTAQLKAQTAAQQYTTAVSNGPSANLVVLSGARSASDDRMTVTERYGIVGAIAGLVIGIVLAFLLARGRDRRTDPHF